MNKKMASPEVQNIRVQLKPLFGIRPGKYLLVFYAILLATILFFLLFYPGIRHHGRMVDFSSNPSGAAVYINDQRAGSTPGKYFVPAGESVVRISYPGFEDTEILYQRNARIFGTLFFPPGDTISAVLINATATKVFSQSLEEASAWSAILQYSDIYQYPDWMTRAMEALLSSGIPVNEYEAQMFLREGLQLASSPELLGDLLHASGLLTTEKEFLGTESLLQWILSAVELYQNYPNLVFYLHQILPEELFNRIAGNELFMNIGQQYSRDLRSFPRLSTTSVSLSSVTKEGFLFYRIPSGQYIRGTQIDEGFYLGPSNFPHAVQAEEIYLGAHEVTNAEFYDFVADNPDWAPVNREILVERNLVTEEYLAHWEENSPIAAEENYPVTHVSRYAAKAYCEWLDTRLDWDGYQIVLPKENEWERAYHFSSDLYLRSEENTLGPIDQRRGITGMRGSVWEWCDNIFHVNEAYFSSSYPELPYRSMNDYRAAEYSVRGGCWANPGEDLGPLIRGGQPPEFCTPFLGFRVAAYKE